MSRVSDGAATVTTLVRSDGVAVVTLNDADASENLWDEALGVTLDDLVDRLRSDPAVRGVVMVSGKPDGFVLGRRLEELPRLTLARDAEQAAREGARRLARLRAIGKPVVAAVHGPALGAGFELALACHAIVASDDPRTAFGLPEVTLGLVPAGNGALRVAERAGLRVALELGTSGESIDAGRALALGLVDEVCPHPILLDVAAWRARRTSATRGVGRRLATRNFLSHRLVLARERRTPPVVGRAAAVASLREVLTRWASAGFDAAAQLEATRFGSLAVSESSRCSVAVALAIAALPGEAGTSRGLPRALVRRGLDAYVDRLRARYEGEMRHLVAEGVAAASCNEAMGAWGWPPASLDLPETVRPRARGADEKPARETIQMRVVLAVVNEALRCFGERVVQDAREGDVGAVLALGFPAFRGGPFRYVDAVGPVEILRRVSTYEARCGARFRPAPVLTERASTGQRFY